MSDGLTTLDLETPLSSDRISDGGAPKNTAGAPAPASKLGPLLDEADEKRVCEIVAREIRARATLRDINSATWERNAGWRKGYRNLRIVAQGGGRPYVRYGFGTKGAPPAPNKTNSLILKLIATLLVDPPKGEAEPATDSDEDRDAAEFASRVLASEQQALRAAMARALNVGGHCASGYVHEWVDPTGGGWEPLQIEAHPGAPTVDAATIDPTTGEPTDDLVPRYAREDGTLADEAVGAAPRWLPAVQRDILSGEHVVLLPETATGIDDAHGAIVLRYVTLGQLKATFPKVAEMGEEQLQALVGWRLPSVDPERILPTWVEVPAGGVKTPDGKLDDASLVLAPIVYMKSHASYPKGAMVVVGGGQFVLHRQPWCEEVGPPDARREECLDIPLAQFRWFEDDVDGNPHGLAPAEKLGPSDEVRHTALAAAVEHLYNFNHRLTLLPMGTTLQPGELARARRTGDPVFVNLQAGKPEFEPTPQFPTEALELHQFLGAEMDSESHLEAPAQGTLTSGVKSGRHADRLVEQSLNSLSGLRTNAGDGFTRLCRIELQLRRAYFTQPQLLKYTGDDGTYKLREWTGADLRSTKDVRIARGTFTMLSQTAKREMARQELEIGLAAQDPMAYPQYKRAVSSNLDPIMALDEDRHLQRIRRQIDVWMQGPGEEALAMAQQAAMVPPQPVAVDPMTGQPVPPPDPLTVAAAQVFAPLLVDDEPLVAWTRHQELARAMASTKYEQMPPGWRAGFDAEYNRARMAAGVQTVAEQQAAAAAQQQAEAEAQAAQGEREAGGKAADRDARAQEVATKEAGATERAQIQADAKRDPLAGSLPAAASPALPS